MKNIKRLIILSVLIISIINGFCQDTTAVVTLKGNQTADQLFKKAKEWFALSFKSANDVIQLTDAETKTIIAKGEISFGMHSGKYIVPMYYGFTFSSQFKDGRYKYEIIDSRIINGTTREITPILEYKEMTTPEGYNAYLKRHKLGGLVSVEKGVKSANENWPIIVGLPNKLIIDLTDYLNKDKNSNW